MDFLTALQILDSTIRLATPLLLACLAGLSRMPFGRFLAALACGSLPLGFAFAAIGAMGKDQPAVALLLSAIVPPILWILVRPLVMRRANEGAAQISVRKDSESQSR